MKKYILLLFITIVGFTVDDVQKERIILDWSETAGLLENGALVHFENTNLQDSPSELPVYTRLYNLNGTNSTFRFVVENPVYEELKSDRKVYREIEIAEELQVSSQVLSSGGSKKIELSIVPLIKEDGTIYRLKSFDLKQMPDVLKSSTLTNADMEWKSNSVLNSGKWVKISTSGKGIYKIPYSKLSSWGFTNPSEVGVFGSGGTLLSENPGEIAYDDLPQCAVWTNKNGGEDCLFFYAPGFTEWTANNEGYFQHASNDYTRTGYFFLGEVSAQKNVELLNELSEAATTTVTTFDEVALVEVEINNLLASGKQWFGEKFLMGSTRNYSFTINNIDETEQVSLKVNAAARSYIASSMGVSVGGTSLGNVAFSRVNTNDTYGLYADQSNSTFNVSASNGNLAVSCVYNSSNSNAAAWLDYLELNYRRTLVAQNEAVFFRDWKSVADGSVVEFSIANATVNTKVFDVSDINNLKEVPGQLDGTTLKVKRPAEELIEYALISTDGSFNEPTFVADIDNQNIHALSTPEFLIISHPNFMSSAEELADFHRSYDEMSVEVVNVNNVYNEFSSGSKSATGIRNCIKMFYDRGNTLKYVLLLGAGSYDNKGISAERNSFIPTFQSKESLYPVNSFVTDDYFVMLDADESVYNGAIDLGIGRIPATTAYEAQLVVDKVKRYYEPEALGDWRNVTCFIGDDGDSGLHMRQSEEIADTINKNYGEFITDKIYFDAYVKETTPAGDRYPDVNAAISERVKDGVLILNYTGHANERYLADEQVLTISDINSWSNTNQLPIFVTATCEFSRFDADETSAGEYVLLNPNGGGIGLFSTTRVVYASANFKLSKSFYSFIFEQDDEGEHYRMGDVMRLAKTNISSSTNKRNFSLLADPALKLSYPKYKVVTSSINQQNTEGLSDTLGTLQKVTVSGYISDYFGNKKDNFSGEIIPTVYDKAAEMKTLGNDGATPITFTVQENIIYKGRASVNNGEFTFSFVIPKDISYSLGQGRIIYYADNGDEDAHGAYTDFYIGGEGSDVVDNQGPDIQLFMDSPDFVSGDKTGKNPTLLAYLSDENGINTIGNGIGHDITAVLDNDYSTVYVLNNYYQAEKDDYTSGSILFPLSDLSVGTHTLTLKAWDVANNSSEAEIEFEVSGDFSIEEISNYPNPVSSYTYFVLKHNQSDAMLDVIFDIYDQNGRRVDQFQTQVGSNGNTSNPIRWDLAESGVAATAGVYVFRALVQNSDGVIASKSGKLVVMR